jgi:NAD-dependent deacetylase
VEKAQVMLVVGTSGKVQPAASLGLLAKKAGAFVVEVNRSRTPQSPLFDISFVGRAGEILPELVGHVSR